MQLSGASTRRRGSDCPPRHRFRQCTSSELRSKGLQQLQAKAPGPFLPLFKWKLIYVAFRLDSTNEIEAKPSSPSSRFKLCLRRQGGPLRSVKLPFIADVTIRWDCPPRLRFRPCSYFSWTEDEGPCISSIHKFKHCEKNCPGLPPTKYKPVNDADIYIQVWGKAKFCLRTWQTFLSLRAFLLSVQ